MEPTHLQELFDAETIVKALGGPTKVARLTKAKNAAVVWKWHRQFGTFPANTYCVMQAALVRRGYYARPHLWSMRGFITR